MNKTVFFMLGDIAQHEELTRESPWVTPFMKKSGPKSIFEYAGACDALRVIERLREQALQLHGLAHLQSA